MKRVISLVLCLLMVLATVPSIALFSGAEASGTEGLPRQIATVLEDTTYEIADGITVRRIAYTSTQGQKQVVAIAEMNPEDYRLYVGTPGDDTDNDGKSSKTGTSGEKIGDMALDAAASGREVLAAINGDFYKTGSDGGENYSLFALLGALIKEGSYIQDGQKEVGSTYFGVRNDGSLIIGDMNGEAEDSWANVKDDLYTAFGGEMRLVVDGEDNFDNLSWRTTSSTLVARYGSSKTSLSENPRTAIGYKADGTVVITVFQGRGLDGAVGVDLAEMCAFMKDLGCVEAMNLDGGGSSAIMGLAADNQSFNLLAGSLREVGEAVLLVKKTTTDRLRELYNTSLTAYDRGDPSYTSDSFVDFDIVMEAAENALKSGDKTAIEEAYALLLKATYRITKLDDAAFSYPESTGYIDLGKVFYTDKILISIAEDLEVSLDGETWTTPETYSDGEGVENYFYPAQSIRYIRFTGNAAVTVFGSDIDKTDLETAVAYAEKLNLDLYDDESAEAYSLAINAGKIVLADENATQEAVDLALAAIKAAKNGLVLLSDKSALETLIGQCEGLSLSGYSKRSVSNFSAALTEAQEIYANRNASQAQVDDIVYRLTVAKAQLKAPLNVALSSKVVANCNTEESAMKITNGTKSTSDYWASQNGTTNVAAADAEFTILLDGLYSLDKVIVYPYWSGSRIYQYEVYATTNGTDFVKVAENVSDSYATSAGFTHTFETPVETTAIKIKGVKTVVSGRTDINNMHIIEVEAFGEHISGNIALGKPVTSSGSDGSAASSGGGYDVRVNDGDITSYWDAGLYSAKPWVTIDFGGIYDLEKINVVTYYSRNDRYYQYEVYTSIDGKDFDLVWTKDDTVKETMYGVDHVFTETQYARYIKLVGLYDSANTSFHVNEIRAYGEEVDYGSVVARWQLETALNRCKEYKESNYTADTFALLTDAILHAESILANEEANEEMLADALELLKVGENSLVVFIPEKVQITETVEGYAGNTTYNGIRKKSNGNILFSPFITNIRTPLDAGEVQVTDYTLKLTFTLLSGSNGTELFTFNPVTVPLGNSNGKYFDIVLQGSGFDSGFCPAEGKYYNIDTVIYTGFGTETEAEAFYGTYKNVKASGIDSSAYYNPTKTGVQITETVPGYGGSVTYNGIRKKSDGSILFSPFITELRNAVNGGTAVTAYTMKLTFTELSGSNGTEVYTFETATPSILAKSNGNYFDIVLQGSGFDSGFCPTEGKYYNIDAELYDNITGLRAFYGTYKNVKASSISSSTYYKPTLIPTDSVQLAETVEGFTGKAVENGGFSVIGGEIFFTPYMSDLRTALGTGKELSEYTANLKISKVVDGKVTFNWTADGLSLADGGDYFKILLAGEDGTVFCPTIGKDYQIEVTLIRNESSEFYGTYKGLTCADISESAYYAPSSTAKQIIETVEGYSGSKLYSTGIRKNSAGNILFSPVISEMLADIDAGNSTWADYSGFLTFTVLDETKEPSYTFSPAPVSFSKSNGKYFDIVLQSSSVNCGFCPTVGSSYNIYVEVFKAGELCYYGTYADITAPDTIGTSAYYIPTVVPGSVDYEIDIDYTFSNSLVGSASGVITLTTNTSGYYGLYWGDSEGELLTLSVGTLNLPYSPIGSFVFATGEDSYEGKTTLLPFAAVPRGAAKLLVTDTEKNVIASCDLPSEKALPEETANYSFGLVSDVHYNYFHSDGTNDDAVAAFNRALAFYKAAGVDMLTAAGDYSIYSEEESYASFAQAVADAELLTLCCGGNHEVISGGSVNMYGMDGIWRKYMNAGVYDGTLPGVLDVADNGHDFAYAIPGNDDAVFIFLDQTYWDNHTDTTEHLLDMSQLTWLADQLDAYSDKTVYLYFHVYLFDDDGMTVDGEGDVTTPGGATYNQGYNLATEDQLVFRSLLTEYRNVIWFNGHSHYSYDMQKFNPNLNVYDYEGTTATMIHVPSVTAPRTANAESSTLSAQNGKASEGGLLISYDDYDIMIGIDFVGNQAYSYATYIIYKDKTDVVSSGTEGNVEWTYDAQTQSLRFTGNGVIPDYDVNTAPYAEFAAEIESIYVGDGITKIGASAFEDFTALTKVEIRDGLEEIGENAFAGDTAIETLVFGGTNIDWAKIEIADGNEPLTSVASKFQKFVITWIVDGVSTETIVSAGNVPEYPGKLFKIDENDKSKKYEIIGWNDGNTTLTALPAASDNATYTAVFGEATDVELEAELYGTGMENWSDQTQILVCPMINGIFEKDLFMAATWKLDIVGADFSQTINIKPSSSYGEDGLTSGLHIIRFQPCYQADPDNRFIPEKGKTYTITFSVEIDGAVYTKQLGGYVLNDDPIIPTDVSLGKWGTGLEIYYNQTNLLLRPTYFGDKSYFNDMNKEYTLKITDGNGNEKTLTLKPSSIYDSGTIVRFQTCASGSCKDAFVPVVGTSYTVEMTTTLFGREYTASCAGFVMNETPISSGLTHNPAEVTDCTKPVVCADCGVQLAAAPGHKMENGFCTVCGYANAEFYEVPETVTELTGANALHGEVAMLYVPASVTTLEGAFEDLTVSELVLKNTKISEKEIEEIASLGTAESPVTIYCHKRADGEDNVASSFEGVENVTVKNILSTDTRVHEGYDAEKDQNKVTVIGCITIPDLYYYDFNLIVTFKNESGEIVKTKTQSFSAVASTILGYASTDFDTAMAQDIDYVDGTYLVGLTINGVPGGKYTVETSIVGTIADANGELVTVCSDVTSSEINAPV